MVLQLVLLEHLDGEDVTLQLGEPLPDTHPQAVSEGDGSEGVSCVVLWTAAEPSLRPELERISEVVGVDHEVPGEEGDHGTPRDLVPAERDVKRSCSGDPGGRWCQSHTLLETGSQILQLLQLRLSDVPVLYHSPDLLVEELLLERIVGEVQEEEEISLGCEYSERCLFNKSMVVYEDAIPDTVNIMNIWI